MADETPDAPEEPTAVPSEEAAEIAGSVEDAALEAFEEAAAAGSAPEPPPELVTEVGGPAVPTEDAAEIAGVTEDAALEAFEEANAPTEAAAPAEAASELRAANAPAEAAAPTEVAPPSCCATEAAAPAEAAADEEERRGRGRRGACTPRQARRARGAPGGGHRPRGRRPAWPRRASPSTPTRSRRSRRSRLDTAEDEPLAEPISTAAIDLAAGARYRATGKRKTAIARVTLRPGTGTYIVNGRTLEQHFTRDTLQRNIRQPLETVGYQDRMDVVARLHGGGISAQAGALRHGVSRALLEADPNLRGELKRRGFLTRDSRAKERKKAGLKKARKRPQFSKR